MGEFLNLRRANCKNCYKCIRHCPVKSIKFSGNQAHIVENECILCGQCFVVCPQNAKEIVDHTEKARVLIQSSDPVIVSLAPSFVASFAGANFSSLEKALKLLGFTAVEETALGATMVKEKYKELIESGEQRVIISSCCHTVNLLIQKHFPQALKYLANVVSPMLAHGMDIKRRIPNAKTVFIGPCISKKEEAQRYVGAIDCVLTFEELKNWLHEEGLSVDFVPESKTVEQGRARLFPTSGGILRSMQNRSENYTYMVVDGLEKCIEVLKDMENADLGNCFIEMSACSGSCIGGPAMATEKFLPLVRYKAVDTFAGREDFDIEILPFEALRRDYNYIGTKKMVAGKLEIEQILCQMGKKRPDQELNCGSCGYNTCREKAQAVYEGKADLTMCLPFLKEKAESFSDNIIYNTPNAIIVLNEDLEVQQINKSARKLMNIRSSMDVLGEPIIRILDPKVFLDVKASGRSIQEQLVYLAEYDRYVEQSVIYDKDYRLLICIMRDVSREQQERSKKENISRQTIEIADKVVDKQMRIVQEIASLLGETAAETKIALTKLKESITDE